MAEFNHLDHIFKVLKRFNPKSDDLYRFLSLGFENKNSNFIISLFNKFNLDPQETFLLCLKFENYDVLLSLFKKFSKAQKSILSRKFIDDAEKNSFNFMEAVLTRHEISDEVASKILPLAAENNKIEIVKLILERNLVNRLSVYSSLSKTENNLKDVFKLIDNYEKKHRTRLGEIQ